MMDIRKANSKTIGFWTNLIKTVHDLERSFEMFPTLLRTETFQKYGSVGVHLGFANMICNAHFDFRELLPQSWLKLIEILKENEGFHNGESR